MRVEKRNFEVNILKEMLERKGKKEEESFNKKLNTNFDFMYQQISRQETGKVSVLKDKKGILQTDPNTVANIMSKHLESVFLPKASHY